MKYEPLWRELYMIFWGLCKDYPTISEIIGLEPENIRIRKNITDTLYKAGYEGVYPDFRKTGELKGVHLTQSYDKAYLVGCEKNVLYMVHCDEMCSDGELIIIFRSGTIVMKAALTIVMLIFIQVCSAMAVIIFQTVFRAAQETRIFHKPPQ